MILGGEPTLGYYWPASSSPENGSPGLLLWSDDDGAQLDLLETSDGWPQEFSDQTFVVHGELSDGSEITLLHARVTRFALVTIAEHISSTSLALGEHTDLAERWSKGFYSTHNLYPWRDQTGMKFSRPNSRARPKHVRLDWQPPDAGDARVKGAQLTFTTSMQSTADPEMPAWAMETRQRMMVVPDRPLTIERFQRRYSSPLISLTSFCVNRPEGITSEIYIDRDRKRRIEVCWSGRATSTRPWRPGRDRMLVGADELKDFSGAIRRWWRLHARVWPALGVFGDHVLQGSTYSPARFLTLYSSVESYGRERHGTRDLKKLRAFARVPQEVIACDNTALSLIGATRGYIAHLGDAGQRFTRARIEGSVFYSTRRLEALMQACLLRELGLSASESEERLSAYYARWPLPSAED